MTVKRKRHHPAAAVVEFAVAASLSTLLVQSMLTPDASRTLWGFMLPFALVGVVATAIWFAAPAWRAVASGMVLGPAGLLLFVLVILTI